MFSAQARVYQARGEYATGTMLDAKASRELRRLEKRLHVQAGAAFYDDGRVFL